MISLHELSHHVAAYRSKCPTRTMAWKHCSMLYRSRVSKSMCGQLEVEISGILPFTHMPDLTLPAHRTSARPRRPHNYRTCTANTVRYGKFGIWEGGPGRTGRGSREQYFMNTPFEMVEVLELHVGAEFGLSGEVVSSLWITSEIQLLQLSPSVRYFFQFPSYCRSCMEYIKIMAYIGGRRRVGC